MCHHIKNRKKTKPKEVYDDVHRPNHNHSIDSDWDYFLLAVIFFYTENFQTMSPMKTSPNSLKTTSLLWVLLTFHIADVYPQLVIAGVGCIQVSSVYLLILKLPIFVISLSVCALKRPCVRKISIKFALFIYILIQIAHTFIIILFLPTWSCGSR